jgi:O-antigen ligase
MIETLIGWLIFAQTFRWSYQWIAGASWAVFVGLGAWWVWRRRWAALLAVWRSPLLPVLGAAIVSALINGGWWSRVADWLLYTVALAWMIDARPDMRASISRVGHCVAAVCVFEWAGLAIASGSLGWRVHLLGNSNVVAALLVLALLVERDRRWWALGVVAVLTTGSRAGLLGLALYGLARLAGHFKISQGWIAVPGLAALAVLMLARMSGTTQRIELYAQSLDQFASAPVFGVGPGNYRGVIVSQSVFWHVHAHNIALSALAEGGMLAAAAWAVAARRAWRLGWHAWRRTEILPFFLLDDMTMWWGVMLGVLYYTISRTEET